FHFSGWRRGTPLYKEFVQFLVIPIEPEQRLGIETHGIQAIFAIYKRGDLRNAATGLIIVAYFILQSFAKSSTPVTHVRNDGGALTHAFISRLTIAKGRNGSMSVHVSAGNVSMRLWSHAMGRNMRKRT